MSDTKKVQYLIELASKDFDKIKDINRALEFAHKNISLINKHKIDSPVLRQLTRDAKAFKTGINSAGSSLNMLRDRLSRLESGRNAAFRTDHISRYNKMIQQTQSELKKLEKLSNIEGKSGGSGAMSTMKGMLGAGLVTGLVGGIYNSGKQQIGDSVESSKKYEKYEAVLKTTLGSKSAASSAMSDIVNFASSTPFQVDELTDSYVKLANRGFQPAMNNMRQLGDFAASQGKGFDQLTEALLDAQTGEFERLKEFGIKAKTEGENIIFNFKGQETQVRKNEKSIQNYVLSLGDLKGVAGGMAEIAKTQAGQASNLDDNIDLLHKTIGDKLKPITEAYYKTSSKVVSILRSWIEVPVERKLQDEINKIRILQTELTSSNTSENRRKEILEELRQINPDITEGIDNEAISYDKLATNIDKVTKSLANKIAMERFEKNHKEELLSYEDAVNNKGIVQGNLASIISQYPDLAANPNMTFGQKVNEARARLKVEAKKQSQSSYSVSGTTGAGTANNYASPAQQDLWDIDKNIKAYNQSLKEVKRQTAIQNKINADRKMMEKLLGVDNSSTTDQNNGDGNGDGTNNGNNDKNGKDIDSVISGGSKPTNINITIHKFQDEIVVQTTNLKEGSQEIERIIDEALLRAVNSANKIAS